MAGRSTRVGLTARSDGPIVSHFTLRSKYTSVSLAALVAAMTTGLTFLSGSAAFAAETTLDWSTRPATVNLNGGSDVATVDGVTVTTTGATAGSRTSTTFQLQPTGTQNGFTGMIQSLMNASTDNGSVSNSVTFTFSEPVYNLRFVTADVDAINNGSSFFTDQIGFTSDGGLPTSATTGSTISYSSATGTALADPDSNCSGDEARCQIEVVFGNPLTSATIAHVAADADGTTNPTNQAIQFRDLFFNTPPDATDNTAATLSTGSASGNVISDNDGFGADSDLQDGANLLVNQISHPDATLSVSGNTTLTLANGAALTIAPNGTYSFDPNGAYAGLADGATTTETFTYRIEDQEGLFNTDGDTVRPDSLGTLVITITGSSTPVPGISLFKSVDQSSIAATGTLNYVITVDNTGSVDLTGISLSDTISQGSNILSLTTGPSLSGDSDGDGVLDTAETWVYTATFNVGQTELDDGGDIVNIATIGSNETSDVTSIATTSTPGPTFACAGDDFSNANVITGVSGSTVCSNTGATGETGEPTTFGGGQLETIWYAWTAPVSGNVTFDTCVATTDYDTTLGVFTGSAVNALTTIVRNDDGTGCTNFRSLLSFTATAGTTYYVQVGGYSSNDGTFQLNWDMVVPAMTVAKSAGQSQITAPGVLSYTILVDNTGTVDLTGIAVVDALTQDGASRTLSTPPTLATGDLDTDNILDTNETWAYTAIYDVTQSDIDNGADLNNLATVSSNETSDESDATSTPITQIPDLSITKSAAFVSGSSPAGVGDVIRYTYLVENTGNVTISSISVTDVHNGLGTFPPNPGSAALTDNAPTGDSAGTSGGTLWSSLAPGDFVTFSEDYIVTQDDVDELQ
ncbi:MAG: hypothetical protein AAFY99_00100 [Pseudomonadota bacterium]